MAKVTGTHNYSAFVGKLGRHGSAANISITHALDNRGRVLVQKP